MIKIKTSVLLEFRIEEFDLYNIFGHCQKYFSKMAFTAILSVSTAFLLLQTANSITIEHAKEQPCFNISNTMAVDSAWAGTLKKLYFPMMSRLDLYRSAVDLTEKNEKEISESSLYYDSCVTWDLYPNGSIVSTGFGGYSKEHKVNHLVPGMQKFEIGPVDGEGYAGTKYTTLTDNKTFLLTPFCTMDGQMTWGVGSITPTLTPETAKLVREHVESLGFKKEFFTELRYDRCNMDMNQPMTEAAKM